MAEKIIDFLIPFLLLLNIAGNIVINKNPDKENSGVFKYRILEKKYPSYITPDLLKQDYKFFIKNVSSRNNSYEEASLSLTEQEFLNYKAGDTIDLRKEIWSYSDIFNLKITKYFLVTE